VSFPGPSRQIAAMWSGTHEIIPYFAVGAGKLTLPEDESMDAESRNPIRRAGTSVKPRTIVQEIPFAAVKGNDLLTFLHAVPKACMPGIALIMDESDELLIAVFL
jgi:hypothetical protein